MIGELDIGLEMFPSPAGKHSRLVSGSEGHRREYLSEEEATDLYSLHEVPRETPPIETHLPAVVPTKIVGVHVNYACRLAELNLGAPAAPTYFLKATSALNAHLRPVIRPRGCQFLNYEGEIGVVIGSVARNIDSDQAYGYVAGYVVANDFALHDFYSADRLSLARAKGADTLAPLGPLLTSEWDPTNKAVVTTVNDKVVQEGNTSSMLWSVPEILADLTATITLYPGDVILTGTPAKSRPTSPGDVVTVWVEGLGVLTNFVEEHENPTIEQWLRRVSSTARQDSRRISLGGDYADD